MRFCCFINIVFFPGLLPQIVGVAPEKAIKLTVSSRFLLDEKTDMFCETVSHYDFPSRCFCPNNNRFLA